MYYTKVRKKVIEMNTIQQDHKKITHPQCFIKIIFHVFHQDKIRNNKKVV